MRQKLLISALFLPLAACGPGLTPPAWELEPPAPRLMKAPAPLPAVTSGADLYPDNAQCSAAYVKETGKLVGLQLWATTVLKKD